MSNETISPSPGIPPLQSALSVPPRPRSLEIDLLRLLCASLLFYYHVGLFTHWPLFSYATYASGTFIALAGYCAVRYSRYRAGLRRPTAPIVTQYFLDRFIAVYPAYAAITLLVFAGSFLYPAMGRAGPFTVTELLCNLLMINQYVGIDYFTNMMWFVPFVLQLYLLVPVLCLFAARASRLGVVACSAFSLLACVSVYGLAPDHVVEVCKDWSPIFRLAPAFVGVAFGMSGSATILPGLLGLWIVCSGARFALLPWLPGLYPVLLRSLCSAAMLPLLLGVVWLIARALRQYASSLSRTVTLLSQATLPFFLGHGILINFLWHRWGANLWGWLGYFAFCWLWSILFVVVYLRVVDYLRRVCLPNGPTTAPIPLIATAPSISR